MNNTVLNVPISTLKTKCSGRHDQCVSFAEKFLVNMEDPELTEDFIKKYISHIHIESGVYNNCLSTYNPKSEKVCRFITEAIIKKNVLITPATFGCFYSYLPDNSLLNILKTQIKIDPSFVGKLILLSNTPSGYGSSQSFPYVLANNISSRPNVSKFLMELIPISQFNSFIDKIKNNINNSSDQLIAEYIKNNSEQYIKENAYFIKLTQIVPYKNNIIKEIYKIVNKIGDAKLTTEIFNKSINNLDKNIILSILESDNSIIPDNKMVDALLNKVHVNNGPRGAINNKTIAEIMDILILYGLKVDRELVIKLLDKCCYINNIEKYDIDINEEMLTICSNHSYYPYKFTIKPPLKVLISECSKYDNLDTIKRLKELGGEYNSECLKQACTTSKNGRVIKYLINECGVKATDECVQTFQNTYRIDALDLIIKGYNPKSNNLTNTDQKSNQKPNQSSGIELDPKSTMEVERREIEISDDLNYTLKSKIKKFFGVNKKSIKYNDLYELVLKYLIANKLVIGNYFVLNTDLGSMLKIESCNILHIDQLHNILTYFIDVQ